MILVITGGTGSLGKAIIAEQELLMNHGISKIRVISRDEQKQMTLQRSYEGSIPLDCYLGDVSDSERMLFALKDSHFVIHAAAQKHIDKFESDIPTGYKTNIQGTQNVANSFLSSKNAISGLLISTDKAVLPITSYGVSKLAAQNIWLWHNSFQKEIKYGVALYGNIFGSRGSVIETWTKLASEFKPLPLTDLQCTRFFMEIQDAAKFVIQKLFRNNCEVQIPKMKACKMKDLAEVIWQHFNHKDDCLFKDLGLRGKEKIHEILSIDGLGSSEVEQFTKSELNEMYKEWLCQLRS